nr:bifunctional phosphopantothenoylcysteine decarboxylase/phosphopantothenate--cysteine ligase CoaBC [uncultured Solibaculum sp.]
MLSGKHILLGVCGGIAAYKAAALASMLTKQGAIVHPILTQNATQFVSPITFEGVSGQRCFTDTFDRNTDYRVPHIKLAQMTDAVLVAPASANTIAKLSHGLADDMLTSTLLACRCKKLIAPAMNTAMFENPVTQDNLKKLAQYGWTIIEPAYGHLACGDTGAGKMPEPEYLLQCMLFHLAEQKDMTGLNVLVTAGPTRESLDPVRYLTNHSSGKMGYKLAVNAARRGAHVTLVTGSQQLPDPPFVDVVHVDSAQEMFDAVTKVSGQQEMLAFAAAVADYRPACVSQQKIKKSSDHTTLELTRTPDILQTVGLSKKAGQLICGFSMETQDLLDNSQAKRKKKNADLMCANSLREEGAGFGVDTNVITLISDRGIEKLPLLSKYDAARKIWDTLLEMRSSSN